MAFTIVRVPSGGLPVVESERGLPYYEADNGYGIPVTFGSTGIPLGTAGPRIVVNKANGRYRLAAALDSLTDGAGSSNYRTTLVPALKAAKGDAGFGYIPCDFAAFTELDQSFGKTAGVNYATALTSVDARGRWNATNFGIRNKAPGGKCLYTIGATGTDSWNTNIRAANQAPFAPSGTLQSSYGYDRLTLWFEIAVGASFSYRQNNAGSGTRIAVNDTTHTPNTIQSLTLVQNGSFNTSILCELITGDVIFYGIEYWKSSAPNQAGVMFSNLGYGGVQTASWAGMDDTYQRNWATLLGFDAWILNGGMNDRTARPYSDFLADLTDVGSRAASAGAKLLVVHPNQPSDQATSNIKDYDPAYIAVAQANAGSVTISDVSVLGTYAQAAASGYMFDLVHPNATGNVLRAGLYQRSIVLN